MAATAALFQSGLPSLNSMPSHESEDLGGESGAEHARKPSESGTEPGSGVDSEDSRGADAYDAHDPILEAEDGKGHGAKSRSGGSMSGKRSYQAMQNHSGGALNPDKKPAVEKPLEELTGEEIQQLTREECRRYLKEKGARAANPCMRRPSWNKAQATQQLLCLKNLLPLNTGMKDEPISDKDASHEGDAGQGNHNPIAEPHLSVDSSNFLPTLFGRSLRSMEKDEYPNSSGVLTNLVAEKVERDFPWNSITHHQRQLLQIHLQQLREQQRQNLQTEINRNSEVPVESASDKASGGTGGGGVASGGEEERRYTQENNSRTESNKSEKKMSEYSPPPRKSSVKRHPRANKRQQGGQRRNSKQNAQDSVTANSSHDLQSKAEQVTEERPQDSKADEKITLNNSQANNTPVNPSISALKKLTSLSPMFSFPNLPSLSNFHGFTGLSPFSSNLSSILNALPQATSSAPLSVSPAFNQTGSLNHPISQLQSLMPSFAPYQSSQPSLNPSSASIPSPVPSSVPPSSVPSPSSFFSLVNANKSTPGSFNSAMASGGFTPSQGVHSNPPLKPLVEADGLSLIPTQSIQQMGIFGSVPQLSPAPHLMETPDFKGTSENSFTSPLLALRLSSGDGSKQDSGEVKGNNRIVRPNPTRPTPQTPHSLLSSSQIKAATEGKEKPSDPLNLTISLGSTLALGSKDFTPMSSRKDDMHAQLPVSFANPDFASPLTSIPKSEGEKMEGIGFYQFRDHAPLPDASREAVNRETLKEDLQSRLVSNPQSALDHLFPGNNSHSGERNPADLQNQLSNWSTVIENLNKIRSYLPSDAFQSLNPSILNAAIMTSLSFPTLSSSANANASENSAQNLMSKNVSTTLPPETHIVSTPVVSNSSLPFFPSSTFSNMPPKRLNLETKKNAENMASNMEKVGKMTIIYNGVMKTFDSVPADKANAIMLLAGNSAPSLPSHQSAENSQQMKSSMAYSRLRFHSHPPSPSPPFSPTQPHQSTDDAHHSSSPPSPAHHSLSPIRSTSSATSILPTSSPQVSPLNSLVSQTPSMLHSHGSGFSEPVHRVPNEHMTSEISGRESSSKNFQSGRVSGSSLSKKTSNATSLPPVSGKDQPEARKASLARFLEKRKER